MAVGRSLGRPARWAALAAGALPGLAFPAPNVEFAAWFALVPGLWLMHRSDCAREAAVRGCWFGAGYLLAVLWWVGPEIGPALPLVAAAFGALWPGVGICVWGLLRPPISVRRAAAALVVTPSAWLVIELIRSWQGLGGPWALLGASQWQHPMVLALAAVGGVWLISAVLVAANTGILVALVSSRTAARATGLLVSAACVAAGPIAYAFTTPQPPVRRVAVALVQPGITSNPQARVDASQRLTASLVTRRRPAHPDLIVWGESSVAYNLNTHPAVLAQISTLSARTGAEILASQDAPRGGGHISKVAVLVSPAGIQGSYTKTRLVPIGEYIPFRPVLGWLAKVSPAASANRVPGTGVHLLLVTGRAMRPLAIGVMICFESAFPDMSRVATGKGAQLIVYQSSTSTYQGTWAPGQHASLGALRAAETGRPVVQAALTGVSAAFDSRGRTLAWFGTSEHGVVTVQLALPPASERTPYDRLGDYAPFTAASVSVIAALAGLIRLRQRRANHTAAPPTPAGAGLEG
jgi:apolipoprotein N-acyltransferase